MRRSRRWRGRWSRGCGETASALWFERPDRPGLAPVELFGRIEHGGEHPVTREGSVYGWFALLWKGGVQTGHEAECVGPDRRNSWCDAPRDTLPSVSRMCDDLGPNEKKTTSLLPEFERSPLPAEKEQRHARFPPSGTLYHRLDHLAVARDKGKSALGAQLFQQIGIKCPGLDPDLGQGDDVFVALRPGLAEQIDESSGILVQRESQAAFGCCHSISAATASRTSCSVRLNQRATVPIASSPPPSAATASAMTSVRTPLPTICGAPKARSGRITTAWFLPRGNHCSGIAPAKTTSLNSDGSTTSRNCCWPVRALTRSRSLPRSLPRSSSSRKTDRPSVRKDLVTKGLSTP